MLLSRILTFPLIFYSFGHLVAQNQGEGNSSSLYLKSETALYSADINIKGKEATEEEKKADKERTSLGIGEPVTLTLSGKAFLMEPSDEIKWSIDKGENLLESINEKDLKGKKHLKLIVRKDLTREDVAEGVQVSVKVKKEGQSPEPVQFAVVLPNKLTAAHIPSGKKGGSPIGYYPQENTYWVGASMILNISVGPTNVNFSNIQITEKNDGESPSCGTSTSLVGSHVADSLWKINGKHEFDAPDGIGISRKDIDLNYPDIIYPNRFFWKCGFKTSDGTQVSDAGGTPVLNEEGRPVYKEYETVEDVRQEFKIEELSGSDPRSGHKVSISKFTKPKCSVERAEGKAQIYTTHEDQ